MALNPQALRGGCNSRAGPHQRGPQTVALQESHTFVLYDVLQLFFFFLQLFKHFWMHYYCNKHLLSAKHWGCKTDLIPALRAVLFHSVTAITVTQAGREDWPHFTMRKWRFGDTKQPAQGQKPAFGFQIQSSLGFPH